MNSTEKKIISMLKENTGAHFLDSGGAYGRNWERNKKINFSKTPAVDIDIIPDSKDKSKLSELLVTYNIYHYLKNFLELNQQTKILNNQFTKFLNLKKNDDKYYPEIMENFIREIIKDDCLPGEITNTYNYDNILSQILQYAIFTTNEIDYFIILQIHGDCDARGGYTRPYIFQVLDYDYFMLAQFDVNLYCTGKKNVIKGGFDFEKGNNQPLKSDTIQCQNNWYCGYTWYSDGCSNDSKPLIDHTYIDKNNQLRCKECNGLIQTNVIEYR